MRQALLISAAFFAAASPSLAAQDRYGPPRAQDVHASHAAPLPAGAFLGWHGKTASAQMAPEPVALQRPEPIAPWARRLAPPQVQPQPQPQQARAIPAPVAAPAPYAPRAMSAPAPVPTAQAPGAAGRPRFYSVARQYGAEPDPIPVSAPQRGQALTLGEIPATENLGRTTAPLDDGRAMQAVAIPDTKENAAANRISRLGF